MTGSVLYDDDILLWSEEQAELIRKFGRTRRDLPNEFDVENVAEEIESVGRSELATVESYIELVMVHLIKLFVEPDSAVARHWRSEIAGFHSNLRRRYAPSMRQRIDMDALWRSAREQMMLSYPDAEAQFVAGLPDKCPIAPDDLLGERIDVSGMVDRVRQSVPSAGD